MRKQSKCIFDSDIRFEFRRIRDIRVRDSTVNVFSHTKRVNVQARLILLFISTVHEVLSTQSGQLPSPQAMSDLQALAGALLDTVNDKNLALSHQRKTNK